MSPIYLILDILPLKNPVSSMLISVYIETIQYVYSLCNLHFVYVLLELKYDKDVKNICVQITSVICCTGWTKSKEFGEFLKTVYLV